jgi:hypothetical protein
MGTGISVEVTRDPPVKMRGPGLRKIGEFEWSALARICSELAPIGLVPMEPKMVG